MITITYPKKAVRVNHTVRFAGESVDVAGYGAARQLVADRFPNAIAKGGGYVNQFDASRLCYDFADESGEVVATIAANY